MSIARRPSAQSLHVSATPSRADKTDDRDRKHTFASALATSRHSVRSRDRNATQLPYTVTPQSASAERPAAFSVPPANSVSPLPRVQSEFPSSNSSAPSDPQPDLATELGFLHVSPPASPTVSASPTSLFTHRPRADKAASILGISHHKSMEPIPASARNSIMSTRSARPAPSSQTHTPTTPLASLYVVSGLPKSSNMWTPADPDSVLGLQHTENAVNRFWRAEVLGSTVSPGAGGGKKRSSRRKGGEPDFVKGAGALSKQEVGKMLAKALKFSFTREVEIIASTLQPASTVHTFTFTIPAPPTPLAPSTSSTANLLRASVLSNPASEARASLAGYPDLVRPSSTYLGIPSPSHLNAFGLSPFSTQESRDASDSTETVAYHGVCLTVWSHADGERSAAIRRALETTNANSLGHRARKESVHSLISRRLKHLQDGTVAESGAPRRSRRAVSRRSLWNGVTDFETDAETEMGDGGASESEFEAASTVHGPGESTLFLPGDTVFWLPYALTLVSRHPIYDLMRDFLTLSWARFSKDVGSHTLQISKILSYPAPRAGDLVKLDASSKEGPDEGGDGSLEVIVRFPGGLDFGRGLVDINFTMWPLFKCLNIDTILTVCEIALAPTGRILFLSRHPAMLGVAVNTIKYLVELRGWNGIALPAVHTRDAKIFVEDPGPWILGLATEARYSVRLPPQVCVVDLDINQLHCLSPPVGHVSAKHKRERYRQRLLAAFEPHYHPDYSVPVEFKEAFPAGRFRPSCKIQAKRGGSSAAVAEQIQAPAWWSSTRIIQAFDNVLQDHAKPSLFRRLTGAPKRVPRLSPAEQHIQISIRKRATAFVDARDDLETKIGRLSRRLNFLLTESDLWRDKFVMFEQYAEKLSGEATDLRMRVGKEQNESKRLSGLVHSTAAEKTKLVTKLAETEIAHNEAVAELERMRLTIARMEQEREDMMAEVEAQIELALASMTMNLDLDDDDMAFDGVRPQSAMSSRSHPRSRRPSDALSSSSHLRSVATDSTLAEAYKDVDQDDIPRRTNGVLVEEEEDEEMLKSPVKTRRFSISEPDLSQDGGMHIMDQGIAEKSDRIAEKVLRIQAKLEDALSTDTQESQGWDDPSDRRSSASDENSESERRETTTYTRPRRKSRSSNSSKPSFTSSRSGPPSAWQRSGSNAANLPPMKTTVSVIHSALSLVPVSDETTTSIQRNFSASARTSVDSARTAIGRWAITEAATRRPTPEHRSSVTSLSDVGTGSTRDEGETPALTPASTSTTGDDSDTDFQSAYSASPRESYMDEAIPDIGSDDDEEAPSESHRSHRASERDYTRGRVSSFATITGVRRGSHSTKDTGALQNISVETSRTVA